MSAGHSLRTVYVDSRYRVSGTASDFKFALRDTFHVDDGTRLHIDNVRFTHCWPIITVSNRYLYFAHNPFLLPATLDTGSYDGLSLAAELQRQTTLNCTYQPKNNSIMILLPPGIRMNVLDRPCIYIAF
jgi:hypothetical protein